MYLLARRFTRNALIATLLLLATPAFMAASHTLMGDLPMTAFWMAAAACFIYGVDRDDNRLLLLAGVASLLAVLTGYQALALLLLLPAYARLKGKLAWKTALPMALPLLGFGAYAFLSLAYYGSLPRFTHAQGLSLEGTSILARVEGNFLQLGGASIFPLIMAGVFCLRRRRWLMLIPVIAGSFGLALYYSLTSEIFPPATAILLGVFLTAAVVIVLSISRESASQLAIAVSRRRVDTDYIFLAFWFLLMLSAVALVLPHATAKYLLPFLAPAVLLFFREMEAAIRSATVITVVALLALALTFVTGTAVSSSDYQLAQTYKDFALGFQDHYEPAPDVWFVGEWGFRHYMESKGYRYLASDSTSPREGDLVVQVGLMGWPLQQAVTDRLMLVDKYEAGSNSPLRVLNFEANAGFYGTHWGKLPFTFSNHPLETFRVYRVTAG